MYAESQAFMSRRRGVEGRVRERGEERRGEGEKRRGKERKGRIREKEESKRGEREREISYLL